MERSLKPDTERLALAIIDGDEEAKYLVYSYKLWSSRATRIVTLTLEDGTVPSTADLPRLRPFPGLTNKGKATQVKLRKSRADFTGKKLAALLNESFASYKSGDDPSRELLCKAVDTFAKHRSSSSYKKFTEHGLEDDLAQDFVLHALKKSTKPDLAIRETYSSWIDKMFNNFAKSQYRNLKTNVYRFEQYKSIEEQEQECCGKHPNNVYWHQLWLKANYFSPEMSDAIYRLSDEDQIYALLLMQGMNQKDAAKARGESAVTARKREDRIRTALQPFIGYGDERGVAQ